MYTYIQTAGDTSRSCNCIGPQKGQPLCPCRMANVTIENGRYIERRDHGPVSSAMSGDAQELAFYSELNRPKEVS